MLKPLNIYQFLNSFTNFPIWNELGRTSPCIHLLMHYCTFHLMSQVMHGLELNIVSYLSYYMSTIYNWIVYLAQTVEFHYVQLVISAFYQRWGIRTLRTARTVLPIIVLTRYYHWSLHITDC